MPSRLDNLIRARIAASGESHATAKAWVRRQDPMKFTVRAHYVFRHVLIGAPLAGIPVADVDVAASERRYQAALVEWFRGHFGPRLADLSVAPGDMPDMHIVAQVVPTMRQQAERALEDAMDLAHVFMDDLARSGRWIVRTAA